MKLDDLLHSKIDNFDAGFDPQAWNNIADKVFENNANATDNSVNNFDAGYDKNAWNNIASQVKANNKAYKIGRILKGATSVAAVAVIGIATFFGLINTENSKTEQFTDISNSSVKQEAKLIPTSNNESTENIQKSKEVDLVKAEIGSTAIATTRKEIRKTIAKPVKEAPKPKQAIAPSLAITKNKLCKGEALNASIIGSTTNLYAKINDKKIKLKDLQNFQFKKAGNYSIALYDASQQDKLISKHSIEVKEAQTGSYSYTKNRKTSSATFVSDAGNLKSADWYIGKRKIGSTTSFTHQFTHKGKYNIKLVTCDANGCKDSSEQLVRILKGYNLLATQVFNPQKETWLPLGLKQSEKEFELKIVSEKGETVFTSTSKSNEWDGKLHNKKEAETGSEFYWVAKLKDEQGKTKEYAGSFIIASSMP